MLAAPGKRRTAARALAAKLAAMLVAALAAMLAAGNRLQARLVRLVRP
jgi:hypothetical protein